MRGILAIATVCAVLGSSAWLVAAETVVPPTNGSAAELVTAALKSELAGPSELRGRLLAEALERDPDYAPARWHSGYVKFDGQWIKVDEVPRKARANESLAAYRKMRDGLIETADNHRALARWCHKNRLLDEERIRWAKVLEFERNDEEAIAALGLQVFNGRLLTKAQIEQEKKQSAEAQRAMQEWQPTFVKWRRAIERRIPAQLDEALRGLKHLDNPAALPALEAVFAVPPRSRKSMELNKLLVETVGCFPQREATDILLRQAIMADSPEVCAAAADQLKKRPMHTYVPTLIAAIPGKLKTRFNVFVLPNGMVSHEHEFYLEGQDADISLTFESLTAPADSAMAALITPAAASREITVALRAEYSAASREMLADAVRKKVQWLLERTTGFNSVDDPELWKAQYDEYYTGVHSSSVKPVYQQSYSSGQTYVSAPTDTRTQTTISNHHSCFPAGTKVVTYLGMTSIEDIKVGDLVLSQDIGTGELRLSPVQSTTLRVPAGMLRITMGAESILVTQAHPFWVVGKGWQAAKHLKVGNYLHALGGAQMIDQIEDAKPSEVYNLVVSDKHNYFVGAARLLVHDNSPFSFGGEELPGLTAVVSKR